MTIMDKLYSKSALILKTVCMSLLPVLSVLLAAVLQIGDGFLYVTVSLLPIGFLYTVPFWMSVRMLKRFRVADIKKFLLLDLATCFAPTALSCIITETVIAVVSKEKQGMGIMTLCVVAICFLITLIFWGLYCIFYKTGRK